MDKVSCKKQLKVETTNTGLDRESGTEMNLSGTNFYSFENESRVSSSCFRLTDTLRSLKTPDV